VNPRDHSIFVISSRFCVPCPIADVDDIDLQYGAKCLAFGYCWYGRSVRVALINKNDTYAMHISNIQCSEKSYKIKRKKKLLQNKSIIVLQTVFIYIVSITSVGNLNKKTL